MNHFSKTLGAPVRFLLDCLSKLSRSAPIRLLPERLPRVFFYGAFLVSFVAVVFYDNRYSQITYPVGWRTSFLNSFTYVIDPLLLHLVGFTLYGYLRWRYLALYHPEEKARVRFVLSFGSPLLLIVASFALEQFVLKPAFRYPRPKEAAEPLGNPWLATWVLTASKWVSVRAPRFLSFAFSYPESVMQDVPSGFALRQLILFYLTVWIAKQRPDDEGWLSRRQRWVVHGVNSAALVFVFFSRVYRANHTFFAMTVAVGVATFLFGSFLAIVYSLSPVYRERDRSFLAETFAAYLAFALVFFTYSNDVGKWLTASVVILSVLSIAYVIPIPGVNPSEEGEQWNRSD